MHVLIHHQNIMSKSYSFRDVLVVTLKVSIYINMNENIDIYIFCVIQEDFWKNTSIVGLVNAAGAKNFVRTLIWIILTIIAFTL